MLSWIALACLMAAIGLLMALAVVDMKTLLLPNEMVLGFAALGLVFHLTTLARFLPPSDIFLGGLAGFGSLYMLRFVANRFHGRDTLGLGDVKLMGAAGIWLGPQNVMMAMAAGAACSLIAGLVYAIRSRRLEYGPLDLGSLSLPAGPGFALGIVATGSWMLKDFRPEAFWEAAP